MTEQNVLITVYPTRSSDSPADRWYISIENHIAGHFLPATDGHGALQHSKDNIPRGQRLSNRLHEHIESMCSTGGQHQFGRLCPMNLEMILELVLDVGYST